jgi:hypothetical protein
MTNAADEFDKIQEIMRVYFDRWDQKLDQILEDLGEINESLSRTEKLLERCGNPKPRHLG